MGRLKKITNWFSNVFKKIVQKMYDGYDWLGTDGIINLESSALLMMVLMVFFPIFWSSIITFIIVIGKCTFDKSRGHEHEKHDFICAVIGILLGIMLGTVQLIVALV